MTLTTVSTTVLYCDKGAIQIRYYYFIIIIRCSIARIQCENGPFSVFSNFSVYLNYNSISV